MLTVEDMLTEIKTADNGNGVDPVVSIDGNTYRMLLAAVRERNKAVKRLDEAVTIAYRAGASWAVVANALGVSRQAAHKRYAPLVEAA